MDPLLAFWTSFIVIALAEVGDKTQLLAIILSTKYGRLPVLLGLMMALSLLSLVAVLCGTIIFDIVPLVYVKILAAISFIVFAAWTFIEKDRGEDEGEVERAENDRKYKRTARVFSYVFGLVFVAEFGDKTQLSTIVLSSTLHEPLWIFLGAVLAFFVVDAPCVLLGKKIAERVNVRHIKIVSGIVFFALGTYFLLEVLGYL